jgi:hypothetical protein
MKKDAETKACSSHSPMPVVCKRHTGCREIVMAPPTRCNADTNGPASAPASVAVP